MVSKKVLDEIIADSPDFLKELVLHDAKYSDRLMIQMKCIEKYKFEESERQKKDIGWNEAWKLWVERDYAKLYGCIYDDNKSFKEIYKKVMNEPRS